MIRSKATVTVNLAAVDAFSDAEIARGVRGASLEGLRIVQDTLSQPGKGRTYTHHFYTDKQGRLRKGKKRDKKHTASAEGDPPAVDTGRLRQSADQEAAGPHGVVSVNAEYAAHLEFGTENIAPRPFLSTLSDSVDRLRAAFVAYAR